MGDVIGVRYRRPSGAVVQEYRIALATPKGAIGDLRVGIEEPDFAATILAAGGVHSRRRCWRRWRWSASAPSS